MSSTVIAKNVQIGADGTASNNFTIFQPATPDGTLRIGNGNTGITSSAVALTSAGNVGIGTSSPGALLNVNYNSASFTTVKISNSVTGNSSTDAFDLVCGTSGEAYVYNRENQPLIFGTNNTERMRIDSSGNVGIGTSSPGSKLDVSGSMYQSGAFVNLGNYNAGTTGNSPNGNAATAFSTNITNGQAEVDIWNTQDPASYANTGILFTQRLTSTTRRDLMFLHNNGNLQFNSGYGSVATAYGCRAWVNFNGTGTVAIRGSGNVSSITDLGSGQYLVNFTIAMPDTNYTINATHDQDAYIWSTNRLTTSVGVYVYRPSSYLDAAYVGVSIFR